jgi:23S rRNA (uracil1939-C5)-methyltransferase
MRGLGHVDEIIGMEDPYGYRNKAQALFMLNTNRQVLSGVYQKSTGKPYPVKSCMIIDSDCDKVIADARSIMTELKIKVCTENNRLGNVKSIMVRKGFKTGQIMAVVVTVKKDFEKSEQFTKMLVQRNPKIVSVMQVVNDSDLELFLGSYEKVLYGRDYIEDELCGCTFRISAKSFYQINPVQTEKLYEKAVEFAKISPNDIVFDAYCGIGTIGQVAAKKRKFKKLIGVEIEQKAIADAKLNAQINGVENAEYFADDAGAFMQKMKEKPTVVFMDPPRAGASTAFLNKLCKCAPRRIVYVSCNPDTLARDCKILKKEGYKIERVQPFDLFPFTTHIETVVSLSIEKATVAERKQK